MKGYYMSNRPGPRRILQLKRLGAITHTDARPAGWSIQTLQDACQRKRIAYEETSTFRNIRGVVVTYGRTSIISIKGTLPEQEKIFATAHELAHIALGHTCGGPGYLLEPTGIPLPFHRDPDEERMAHAWAARLLVDSSTFEKNLH